MIRLRILLFVLFSDQLSQTEIKKNSVPVAFSLSKAHETKSKINDEEPEVEKIGL